MTAQTLLLDRRCAWCGGEIWATRRDAITCSKECRQAKARFRVRRAELEATDRVHHFAYADPPYPGRARYYPENVEVDHVALVARLERDYPDGWALSTHPDSLRDVLGLVTVEHRVCAWIKSPRVGRGWEPVIVAGGRARHLREPVDDFLISRGRQHSHPGALIGMKPGDFGEWVFRNLGARRGDRLDDLYPGSGAIGRAWSIYTSPGSRRTPTRAESADTTDRAV